MLLKYLGLRLYEILPIYKNVIGILTCGKRLFIGMRTQKHFEYKSAIWKEGKSMYVNISGML